MLIISNKPGQLGNRLWVFAHLIGYGIEHQVKIYNPAFDEYAHLFEGTQKGIICSYPPSQKLKSSKKIRHFMYKLANITSRISNKLKTNNFLIKNHFLDWSESFDLDKNQIVNSSIFTFLNGWLFRGEDLLNKHQKAIREYFNPSSKFTVNVDHFLKKHRDNSMVTIGVHIRRGDYKNFENGRYFFDLHYYNQLMLKIEEVFSPGKIQFIICSNEKIKSKEISVKNWIHGPGHYFEDMLVLSECNLIVGPPSTFSLWAAFYGKKKLLQIDSNNLELINVKIHELFQKNELSITSKEIPNF